MGRLPQIRWHVNRISHFSTRYFNDKLPLLGKIGCVRVGLARADAARGGEMVKK